MVLIKVIATLICLFVIASEIEYILFDYKLGKSMYNEPFDIGRYFTNIMFIALSFLIPIIMWF